MGLKVGDKVLLTGSFILNLPELANKLKEGGIITTIYETEAEVMFYNGDIYVIYLSNLKLKFLKNQQLLFGFIER